MSVYRIQGEGLTYNQNALIKCKMNNPEHFECLKENFPIVARKPIDNTIAKTLFERALIQKNVKQCLYDLFLSIRTSPLTFINVALLFITKKIKSMMLSYKWLYWNIKTHVGQYCNTYMNNIKDHPMWNVKHHWIPTNISQAKPIKYSHSTYCINCQTC